MKKLVKHLYGDKYIWALVILLAFFSFMPVYSASTNLVYTIGTGQKTTYYLFKHFFHMGIGLSILWTAHRFEYRYFRAIGILGIPVVLALLMYALLKGTTISGANASRWVSVLGIPFQPSSIASVILLMYVAQYLVKIKDKVVKFWPSFVELWLPVLAVVGLIFPANFSTAALIFLMVCILVFVGKYPIKHLSKVIAMGFLMATIFVGLAKIFPGSFSNRVDTWISRVERFTSKDDGSQDLYQVENAKMAIALGGVFGVGPGKGTQKNFLPQSSSDFIYAIIVEEYGLVVGLIVLVIYLYLFLRFLVAAHRAPNLFGRLLVVGLGFLFIFQAMINMGVAVSLLPTTGQPLPLISSGGTSIWMTCFSLGVILSVTKKEKEIQQQELEKELAKEREIQELERLIREREIQENKINQQIL